MNRLFCDSLNTKLIRYRGIYIGVKRRFGPSNFYHETTQAFFFPINHRNLERTSSLYIRERLDSPVHTDGSTLQTFFTRHLSILTGKFTSRGHAGEKLSFDNNRYPSSLYPRTI